MGTPTAYAWMNSVGPYSQCVSGPPDSITQVIYLVTLSHKLVKHVTTLCWLNYLPDFEFLPVHVAVKGRIFKLMCLFEGGKR